MTFKGPQQVIIDGDMSGSMTSLVTIKDQLVMLSYSITWSGSSPVGAISVQTSDDYSQNVDGSVKTAGTWNTLPLSAPTLVSGNTGNGFIDIVGHAGYALRLVYTATSGTGTMQAFVMGQ